MSGVVVWFTGPPSSGKSTLAGRVAAALRRAEHLACVLDGDELRAAIVPSPGYDPEARANLYETLARLAAMLAGQGLIVLVAATAHRRAFRDRAREIAPRFVEVFVDTPIAICAARDAKGLYAAARAGEVVGVPGAGVDYEPPESPEIQVKPEEGDFAVERIIAEIAR